MSNESNGWSRPLMVTLTATSNQYLADKLPLRGLLQILEMDVRGYAMPRHVTFTQMDEKGNPVGTRVMVDDAEFSYALPSSGEKPTQDVRPVSTPAETQTLQEGKVRGNPSCAHDWEEVWSDWVARETRECCRKCGMDRTTKFPEDEA